MAIYHGRNTKLLVQREVAFRTAPAAAAFDMKFEEFEFNDELEFLADNTINANALAEKRDCDDVAFTGRLKSTLDLNDVGQWLTLLWGLPVTAGAGPYTHTFSLNLDERPTALMELAYQLTGADEFRRLLGCAVNTIQIPFKEGDKGMELGLMLSEMVSPNPGAVFDAAPTAYAKNRVCHRSAEIISPTNSLGRIVSGTVDITNDFEGKHVADGNEGYGVILLGQPGISGSLTALLFDGDLRDREEAHTSTDIRFTLSNEAGDNSLVMNFPNIEFDKPSHSVTTSKGLVQTANWRAHQGAGTLEIVLTNGISTYV